MKKFLHRLDPKAMKQISATQNKGGRIAVACSGGSDSVFLLLCALEIMPRESLCVLHFNHAVRKNADTDEAFVKNLCKELGVECVSSKRKTALKKISEETLRNARLNFIAKTCAKMEISTVLQGHIKDDIAESALMRLACGASLDGLCAPRPLSENKGLTFARPLLGISKKEILAELKKRKCKWREDESNAQETYFRNRMRLAIIPEIEKSQNRSFKDCAARTRMLLEEDAELIAQTLARHCKKISPSEYALDVFASRSAALARRCIQRILAQNALKLRAQSVDVFVADIAAKKSAKASLEKASLSYNAKTRTISLLKKFNPTSFEADLKFGKNILPDGSAIMVEKIIADKKLFDHFKTGGIDESKNAYIALSEKSLRARSIRSKDAYAPIGASKPRLVREMMSAKKTDILKRKRLPLVCFNDGSAVWAPTLAPAEAAKIEKGKCAIRLTYFEQA